VHATGWSRGLEVTGGGSGVVSHAGLVLLRQLGGNTRGDPAARWTAADGGMHVLALLLYDTVRRGGFDPAAGSYADFLVRALSDANTWPRDLEARYLELTATRHS
jgi:hypothetical protein